MIAEKEYYQLKVYDSLVFVGNGSTIINGFTKGDIVTIVDKYDMDDNTGNWGCIIIKGIYNPNEQKETFHFSEHNIMRYFSKFEEFYSPENLKSMVSDVQYNTLIGNKEVKIPENKDSDSKIKAFVEQVTPWKRALNAARRTIGKNNLDKEPSDNWKAQAILAEHSPIRTVIFNWSWENIRQWVTTHLIRHHAGVEKFVHSQREDRRDLGIPRDELPQGSLNDMEMEGNIQAMINISRKRVCNNASKETREAWKAVLDEVEKIDPVLGEKLKLGRECVYRGFCPEFKCCGYCNTKQYQEDLKKYRNTKY